MLQDASLTLAERNLITTAVSGDFRLQRVAQELRGQFPETDMRYRENPKHQGYLGQAENDEDQEDEELEAIFVAEEDLTEEGFALWSEAADEADQALAALEAAKKTLKAARARQHDVRLSRRYFKPGQKGQGKGGPGKMQRTTDDSQMKCLKCGRIGHRAANCNEPRDGPSRKEPEQAPFVCYTDATELALSTHNQEIISTQQAVDEGYCVVDGGATRTLGSVYALEALMRKNQAAQGNTGMLSIDRENCPVFCFGNSTEDRCQSTVCMQLHSGERQGQLQVHTLDKGTSPILLSISSLRALGALIDFERDLIVFRNVDPTRVIQARRSATGHQLLPLSGNLYAGSQKATRPIAGLAEFVKLSE